LVLEGGKDNFGAIYQRVEYEPNDFVNLEYQYANLLGGDAPAGTILEFRLHADSMPGSPNQVLFTHEIAADTSTSGWQHKFVSVPVSNLNPEYRYLVVCARNTDWQMRSLVGLDNLVICTSDALLTDVGEAAQSSPLRIFPNPNPNPGSFTVELPAPATPDLALRIIGLTGQVLRQQTAQTGNHLQTVEAGDLPTGLYFLQVLHEGRVVAVEKFVKQ
jgi:hypothetical protein